MAVMVKASEIAATPPGEPRRLRIIDFDSLPPPSPITDEEIAKNPQLESFMRFPVASDEEIEAMETAIQEARGHAR